MIVMMKIKESDGVWDEENTSMSCVLIVGASDVGASAMRDSRGCHEDVYPALCSTSKFIELLGNAHHHILPGANHN